MIPIDWSFSVEIRSQVWFLFQLSGSHWQPAVSLGRDGCFGLPDGCPAQAVPAGLGGSGGDTVRCVPKGLPGHWRRFLRQRLCRDEVGWWFFGSCSSLEDGGGRSEGLDLQQCLWANECPIFQLAFERLWDAGRVRLRPDPGYQLFSAGNSSRYSCSLPGPTSKSRPLAYALEVP